MTESKNMMDAMEQDFIEMAKEKPDMSWAVCAVTALTNLIKKTNATTMMELDNDLKTAVQRLVTTASKVKGQLNVHNHSNISLLSACELFMRFVTRQFLESHDFFECKRKLIERGEYFATISVQSRQKVARLFDPFFRDRMVVLIHGFSRVVIATLLHAAKTNKRFSVFVTETRPDCEGYKAEKILRENGIPTTIILDSAAAHYMSKVDFVLVGCEGVVENGGIINKIGTYQIGIIAKAHKKPLYVAAESFKFVRQYPLDQSDIKSVVGVDSLDNELLRPRPITGEGIPEVSEHTNFDTATLDYTPPAFITLLMTDIGTLTPSAVSDELIKLYY